MPADTGARCVFGDQRLLEILRLQAGEIGGERFQRIEEVGHRVALAQRAAAAILVAPAEGDDPAVALKPVEVEIPEGQGAEPLYEIARQRLRYDLRGIG